MHIVDVKLFDTVALYLFCVLGLAWVGFCLLGRRWVGLDRQDSGFRPANWTHVQQAMGAELPHQ